MAIAYMNLYEKDTDIESVKNKIDMFKNEYCV